VSGIYVYVCQTVEGEITVTSQYTLLLQRFTSIHNTFKLNYIALCIGLPIKLELIGSTRDSGVK
jgi:hypothetical protein